MGGRLEGVCQSNEPETWREVGSLTWRFGSDAVR